MGVEGLILPSLDSYIKRAQKCVGHRFEPVTSCSRMVCVNQLSRATACYCFRINWFYNLFCCYGKFTTKMSPTRFEHSLAGKHKHGHTTGLVVCLC
jgi:hypothetical protein